MRHWAPPAPVSYSSRERNSGEAPWGASTETPLRRHDVRLLAVLLILALALRVAAIPGTGFAHQDELFQYFEAAHRLVFGPGIVPWEYRYGMRNWLLPLLVAGPMRVGAAIGPGTDLYLLLPRFVLTGLSLAIVAGAWRIGRRISPLHGLVAGTVAAIWPELVHFAPHALAEPVAVALILPAAALITSGRRHYLVTAGLLLGVAGLIRFQYLPAIGALVLIAGATRRETWLPLLTGAAMAAIAGALVDAATGLTPFGWLAVNIRENFLHARAAHYGVAGPLAYFSALQIAWAGWALPIAALAIVGARRRPDLLAAALVNLGFHSAIAHKEYRFIFLTSVLVIVLAAVGTADILAWQRRRLNIQFAPFAIVMWGITAATLAATGRQAAFDIPAAPARVSFAELGHDPALCGLATSGISFADAGGYTLLHRAVPLFAFDAGETAALIREAAAFNRIVAPQDAIVPPGYVRGPCHAGAPGYAATCTFARPGACTASAATHQINTVLKRIDQ